MFRKLFASKPRTTLLEVEVTVTEDKPMKSKSQLHDRITDLNMQLPVIISVDAHDRNVTEWELLVNIKGTPMFGDGGMNAEEARAYLREVAKRSETYREVAAQVEAWLFA